MAYAFANCAMARLNCLKNKQSSVSRRKSCLKANANMCKSGQAALLILLSNLWLTPATRAQSNTNVVVALATTNAMPFNQGFAGFATEMLDTGLEYDNTNFQQFVTALSPDWLRCPSGISDDAFNWATGLTNSN